MRLAVILLATLIANIAIAGSWNKARTEYHSPPSYGRGWEEIFVYIPGPMEDPSSRVRTSLCGGGIIVSCYGDKMTGIVEGLTCHRHDECRTIWYPLMVECDGRNSVMSSHPVEWVQIRNIEKSGNGQKFVIKCIL